MIYAADSGNLGIVNSLLKAGAKIDEQSSTENTALICGESERNGDIGLRRLACATRELVFNVFDLDTAAVRGHTAVANRLIEGKASVDIAGEGGASAMMKAAYNVRIRMISSLVLQSVRRWCANASGLRTDAR